MRTYASASKELDVNGIGPFSLFGSRLDSDACCQPEVQDLSPHLRGRVIVSHFLNGLKRKQA
jgi:hypothetical protein